MRAMFFDCFSGISGDMCLGALIDAGADGRAIAEALRSLPVPGLDIVWKKVVRKGITATDLQVIGVEEHHHHRHLKDIYKIIDGSGFSPEIKEKSKQVFFRLAEAEAAVHGTTVEEVHFHEVGAVDTIADIVGSIYALNLLGIEQVYSSPLPLGSGFVRCQHGVIPVPAPATVQLLKGVPVYQGDEEGELVTPTGAAIITTVAKSFGPMPQMTIESIGYGAGKRILNKPNLLRVIIGDIFEKENAENLVLIETNIDNMNPEIYSYVMDQLFNLESLDVFFTPIQMKKNRPAVMLSVLTHKEKLNQTIDCIFKETTTLGIRVQEVSRFKKTRKFTTVDVLGHQIKVKTSFHLPFSDDKSYSHATPEFEDCRQVAEKTGLPLKEVYNQAIIEIAKQRDEEQ